jgi:3-oxoacyl-[acyl-carrier protein] reductase
MLLEGKTALIYGAGSIGSAVAAHFAREGAHVHLASRDGAKADAVVAEIGAEGGAAKAYEVDALDEGAVDAFVDGVARDAGSIDISFNLISVGDVQGTPMVEMEWDDFVAPIEAAVRSNFLTVKAAARPMSAQGAGVVLFFGGSGDPLRDYSIGGFQVALHAVEAMRRQYSAELGSKGVRFVTLRTAGIPETLPPEFGGGDELTAGLNAMTMTGRAASLRDVCEAAAFVASDKARAMTAATVNVTAGALIDN